MKKEMPQTIALRYGSEASSKAATKRQGDVGNHIIELAKKNDITIQQNPELTNFLSAIRINQEIPGDLYTAAAQILAFLYRLDGKK